MNRIKSLLTIFTSLYLLSTFTACTNQITFYNSHTKLHEYNFSYKSIEKVDDLLKDKPFTFSQDILNKVISVIVLDSKHVNVKEYKITDKGLEEIVIAANREFIISLPTNPTITYTWNIKNDIKNVRAIKYVKRTQLSLPTPKSEEGKNGAGYSRENLYFEASKNGTQELVLRYEHQESLNNEYYETTLKVIIRE